jgi:uncharacterized membrane-anchored protein YhcB (DUF1043 family)
LKIWNCLFSAFGKLNIINTSIGLLAHCKNRPHSFRGSAFGTGGRLRNAVATSVLFGVYASPRTGSFFLFPPHFSSKNRVKMLLLTITNTTWIIIAAAAALVVGLAVGYFITATLLKKAVTKEEQALLEEAKEKAEVIKKERILQAKEKFLQMKDEHEKACDERNRAAQKVEQKANQLKQEASQKMDEAQRKNIKS